LIPRLDVRGRLDAGESSANPCGHHNRFNAAKNLAEPARLDTAGVSSALDRHTGVETGGEKTMPYTDVMDRYRGLRAVSTHHHSPPLSAVWAAKPSSNKPSISVWPMARPLSPRVRKR
jgi:hypothetical protein